MEDAYLNESELTDDQLPIKSTSSSSSTKNKRKRGKKPKKNGKVYVTGSGRESRKPKKLYCSSDSGDLEDSPLSESPPSGVVDINQSIDDINKSLNLAVATEGEGQEVRMSGKFEAALDDSEDENSNSVEDEIVNHNETQSHDYATNAAPSQCRVLSNVEVHSPIKIINSKATIAPENMLNDTQKVLRPSGFVPKTPSNILRRMLGDTPLGSPKKYPPAKNNETTSTNSMQNGVTREEVQEMLTDVTKHLTQVIREEIHNLHETLKESLSNDLDDFDPSNKPDDFPLQTVRDFEIFEKDANQQSALKKYLIGLGGGSDLGKCARQFLRAAMTPQLYLEFTWGGENSESIPLFESKLAKTIWRALIRVRLLKKGDLLAFETSMRKALHAVKQNVREVRKKTENKGYRTLYKDKMSAMYGGDKS